MIRALSLLLVLFLAGKTTRNTVDEHEECIASVAQLSRPSAPVAVLQAIAPTVLKKV